MECRQAQWHADKAVRLHSPAVETALLLKCEALLALGKYAEALNETRSLTIQGDPMATEVLTVRAQALYLTGEGLIWTHVWVTLTCHTCSSQIPCPATSSYCLQRLLSYRLLGVSAIRID